MYPATSMRRPIDAAINFGQAAYINSLLPQQSILPYEHKRLFTDTISIQIKTQANSRALPGIGIFSYLNLAQLHVCNSVVGANGYPTPGNKISAFESDFNPVLSAGYYPIVSGSPFWGIQNALYDIYTDPITGAKTSLTTYMWQFQFGSYLNSATDSGTYFLRFDYLDVNGNITPWYSEPIFVFGTDAQITFPDTLEFESANAINKNDIIIDGWFNNPASFPSFYTRVEADILEYEPKGIYLGFLQQDYLAETTYTKSWEIWSLNIGSTRQGVPKEMFRILAKFMEMDYILINNQYYIYDIASGGSPSPTSAWKMDKARWKGLYTGSIPIRYKYENQFYVGSNIQLQRIFDGTFDGVFG